MKKETISQLAGYVLAIFLIILLANQCKRTSDLKRDNIIANQNVLAADSAMNVYKNKNGALTAEKNVWILTEKQLKEKNSELYALSKEQSGKLISLNNVIFRLRQDTTLLHDSIKYLHSIIGEAQYMENNNWNLPWELSYKWDDDNYDIFKGHTLVHVDTLTNNVKHLDTKMDFRESQIDLTFGEKVVDGKYNVYITTKYPGLSTASMQGVFIDPNSNKYIKDLMKKKHWFTGFSISVGLTPGYDIINQKPAFVVGPTIGYNIFQW